MIDLSSVATPSASAKGHGTLWQRASERAAGLGLSGALQHLPLSLFKRLPTILVIDVTNSCNLRCPVCPVTFAMTRPRGLMTFDIFTSIIDDFVGQAARPAVYFNFSGEPTLNKALPDMVAYAARHGHETFISTNATKLEAPMIERLIGSGLSRINLCMDGFSAEAQESYRVNSKFETVKRNIELFLSLRAQAGSETPLCVLQTLLTSFSEGQMDEMLDWADSIGFDQVRFKTFSLGSYTDAETRSKYAHFLPKRRELLRHQTETPSNVCSIPLYQTVVFWNGDLGLCCIDYDQMVALPNVQEKGFVSAYLSDDAARARRTGFLKNFSICKDCSYSNADNMGFKINLRKRRQQLAAAQRPEPALA